MAWRGSSAPAAAVATAVTLLITGGPALAAWNAGSSGATGYTEADSLPAGSAPTAVTRLGRDVDVTWPQVLFRGQPLGNYSTGRYTMERNVTAAAGTCTAPLSPGGVVLNTCRETGLAPGSYAYRVTPRLASWSGAASSPTNVVIPAPTLTFSPATLSAPGASLIGTVDAFLDDAALTYRLGNATSGAVLAGTLATFPTAPATAQATSVPIGCGPATGNPHDVYLSGSGEQAVGSFGYDFSTVLCPSALTSTVGSAAGQAQALDTLVIAFSRAVNGGSICSGLPANGITPGSLRATIRDGGTGNDTLEVTAPAPSSGANQACGSVAPPVCVPPVICVLGSDGVVNLGTFNLGSAEYATSGDVTFGTGTSLALDPDGKVVTLKLGTKGGATNGTAPSGSITKYTPSTTITSAFGNLPAQGHMTSADRVW